MALMGSISEGNSLVGTLNSAGTLEGSIIGAKGDKGDKGDTGDTGNGIASITKTSTLGLVDTYTITYTNGTTATFTVTNGADGQDGQDGADGHSPVVTASKSGTTTTVYVDGSSIATIEDGADGQDGQNGQDGYSPSASVSKSGDTATITITDKDSTTTATITDGQDGADGQDGQDGHTPVITASKTGKVTTVYVDGTAVATINDGQDGEQNVQSDWNEADNTKDDYIKNKPSIHNIPSGGSSGQVLSKSSGTDYDVAWSTVSGGGGEIPYCTCADSASTVAKTATVQSGSFTSLTTGAQVAVKFTYQNTATNPTLNVAGTGAKGIRRGGTTYVGTNANLSWNAGTVVILVYDGTDWQIANWLNTTYDGGTEYEIEAGSVALNKVWSPQQIHNGINRMLPSVPSIGSVTVTLSSSGWTSDTQTVTATGVTSSNNVVVSPDASDMDDYVDAGIKCTAQGTNTLTFSCDTEPSSSLDVNVLIFS